MFSRKTFGLALLALAPVTVAACDDDADDVMQPQVVNLVETAQAAGSFTTLIAALDATGLRSTLESGGVFTVFAPTDAAFAAVPADILNTLLADVDLLTQVLTYHVVPGRVLSSDVVGLSSASTLNGADVSISVKAGSVFVDNAQVVATDVQGTNGVIHVIDAVILPPAVLAALGN